VPGIIGCCIFENLRAWPCINAIWCDVHKLLDLQWGTCLRRGARHLHAARQRSSGIPYVCAVCVIAVAVLACRELALESGVEKWGRVPALNTNARFIEDLADAVVSSRDSRESFWQTAVSNTVAGGRSQRTWVDLQGVAVFCNCNYLAAGIPSADACSGNMPEFGSVRCSAVMGDRVTSSETGSGPQIHLEARGFESAAAMDACRAGAGNPCQRSNSIDLVRSWGSGVGVLGLGKQAPSSCLVLVVSQQGLGAAGSGRLRIALQQAQAKGGCRPVGASVCKPSDLRCRCRVHLMALNSGAAAYHSGAASSACKQACYCAATACSSAVRSCVALFCCLTG